MVAWARARREGCGSWRTPAAGCPEACPGNGSPPPKTAWGNSRPCLMRRAPGRDQARRDRFAGRQAHERASAQVARLQCQVNEITSQLGGVQLIIRCPGWEPSPACRGERRWPVRFVEPPWRPALRQALPAAAASGYQPAPNGGKLQEVLCTDGEWHLVTILGKMRGADGWRVLVARFDGHTTRNEWLLPTAGSSVIHRNEQATVTKPGPGVPLRTS